MKSNTKSYIAVFLLVGLFGFATVISQIVIPPTPVPLDEIDCDYNSAIETLYCDFDNNFNCRGMEVTYHVRDNDMANGFTQYIYDRCVAGTIVVTTTTLPKGTNETVRAYL